MLNLPDMTNIMQDLELLMFNLVILDFLKQDKSGLVKV